MSVSRQFWLLRHQEQRADSPVLCNVKVPVIIFPHGGVRNRQHTTPCKLLAHRPPNSSIMFDAAWQQP